MLSSAIIFPTEQPTIIRSVLYPMTYKIVRNYFNGTPRTIKRGLTLEEAQSHCKDPETSSSTCTNSVGRSRTNRLGPWFDSWTEEG